MSSINFNQTYTSNATITIPSDAFNISLVVAGGSGGGGGSDSNGSGGGGGSARRGYFTLPNYVSRTLTLQPGGAGEGGPGCFGRGTNRSSGSISGGRGGSASGCSGSGGGGGGGSGVYDSTVNGYIIVAGGGGGGGGGAWNRSGGGGGSSGGFSNVGGIGASGGGDGNGASCGDGSGGGGGGGGAGGGSGGGGGCDNGGSASGGGAGGSQYRAAQTTLTGQDSYNGGGYITVSYTAITPVITTFTYDPIPQTSGTVGVPDNTVKLIWQVSDAAYIRIYDGATLIHQDTNLNSFKTGVNTGLQSVTGTNSPASKTYTLIAYASSSVTPTITTSTTVTVQVYNDNTPNTYTIPSTAELQTTGVSYPLNQLEPNSSKYIVSIGPITGIDMIVKAESFTSGVDLSVNKVNWSNVIYPTINQYVYIRFFANSYLTDSNGFGITNPRLIEFSIGSTNSSFYATTRAPDTSETFDFGDDTNDYPYPDIDQMSNTPSQYIVSPTTVTIDDVDVDVEIKVDNPDAQIRVKQQGETTFGSWQTPRGI